MHPAAGNRVLCGWDKCTDDHLAFCLFKTFDDGLFGNELVRCPELPTLIFRIADKGFTSSQLIERLNDPLDADPMFPFLSAVESKPASDGRIKTSHFFCLNRAGMFWQEVILHWGLIHQIGRASCRERV